MKNGTESLRKLAHTTDTYTKGLSKEVLNGFFTMLENLLDTLGIKDLPKRFFNLDETGLSLDPMKKFAFFGLYPEIFGGHHFLKL